MVKIIRIVTWYNPKDKVGEHRLLNEIASSHLARRKFIGNLYSQVQDPNLIGSMTGHVEESMALIKKSRYLLKRDQFLSFQTLSAFQ